MLRGKVIIKRTHGLGNLVLLLPVLHRLHHLGWDVTLLTRSEWADVFSQLVPDIAVTHQVDPDIRPIDLDLETLAHKPVEHRTLEFARILEVEGPFNAPCLHVPWEWRREFDSFRNAVLFAPEAGHQAREWPQEHSVQFLQKARKDYQIVVAGTRTHPPLPADHDLRGLLTLRQLIALLATVKGVISMDSGTLYLAAAIGTPTLALFGGIDPSYRVLPQQKVTVLRTGIACSPCNKEEVCSGAFACLSGIQPEYVLARLETLAKAGARTVCLIPDQQAYPWLSGSAANQNAKRET